MTDRDSGGRFAEGHASFVKKGMHAGKRHSPGTEFQKGNVPANAGNGAEIQCPCGKRFYVPKYRVGKARYCSRECANRFQHPDPFKNKPERTHAPEARAKISAHQRANPRRGADNAKWTGGNGTERHQAMGKFEYKEWRNAVFVRDDHACVMCGVRGSYVHADHIKPWADHPELRYNIENGRTLCFECHYEVTFGYRDFDKALMWGVPTRKRGSYLRRAE